MPRASILASAPFVLFACSSAATGPASTYDSGSGSGSGNESEAATNVLDTGGIAPIEAGPVPIGEDAPSELPDASALEDTSPPVPDAAGTPDTGVPSGGAEGGSSNTVLMIDGAMPTVGLDGQYRMVLQSKGLVIQDIRETVVKPSDAIGKRLVLLSYSVDSAAFDATPLASIPVPMIVTEHMVLGKLGMTTAAGHGFQEGETQIAIISSDPVLTAGFPMGNLTVYGQTGEFFWGLTGPGAVNVATIPGTPAHVVYFAYPAGVMMAGGLTAPAKRMLFFAVAHTPNPYSTVPFMNADGLKVLGGAIDWMLK
jgi:hypothetical protein